MKIAVQHLLDNAPRGSRISASAACEVAPSAPLCETKLARPKPAGASPLPLPKSTRGSRTAPQVPRAWSSFERFRARPATADVHLRSSPLDHVETVQSMGSG